MLESPKRAAPEEIQKCFLSIRILKKKRKPLKKSWLPRLSGGVNSHKQREETSLSLFSVTSISLKENLHHPHATQSANFLPRAWMCVCNVCVWTRLCVCMYEWTRVGTRAWTRMYAMCEWTRVSPHVCTHVWVDMCVCAATCVHLYRNLNGSNLLSQSCSAALTAGPCLLQWQNGTNYKYRAFLSLSSPGSSSENLFLKFSPQIPILRTAEQFRRHVK